MVTRSTATKGHGRNHRFMRATARRSRGANTWGDRVAGRVPGPGPRSTRTPDPSPLPRVVTQGPGSPGVDGVEPVGLVDHHPGQRPALCGNFVTQPGQNLLPGRQVDAGIGLPVVRR